MKRLVLAVLGIAVTCFAFGQREFVAFEFSGSRSKINFMTGEKTPFGVTGGISQVNAAASQNGVVYVGAFNGVYRINAATGGATSVVTGQDIRGLAFLNDKLCAIKEQTGSDQFVTINRTTGALTVVGLTGLPDIQALANTPSGGLLAWSFSLGLVTVNPATGVATDVGPGSGPFMQSIEYDQDGVLYGICPSEGKMYRIDPATGGTTYLFDVPGDIRGLAQMGLPARIYACGPGGNYEIDASTGRAFNIGGATRSWKSVTPHAYLGDIVGIDGFLWHFIDQGNAGIESGAPLTQNFRAIAHNPNNTSQDLWCIFDGALVDTLYQANSTTGLAQPLGATGFNEVTSICYSATTLYGWDSVAGLITINGTSGVGTDVSAANAGTNLIHSLVLVPDGPLYGVGTNRIYSIDRGTGAWFEIGGTLFTNVTAACWMPGYSKVRGVSGTGDHYWWSNFFIRGALSSPGGFGNSNASCATLQGWFLVGGLTNTLTFVDPRGQRASVQITPSGGFGPRGLADLDGKIYAIRDAMPSDRLERYDSATNSYTFVGSTGFSGLQSLATSPTGRLIAWDVSGPGLVRIDPATGVGTDVNPVIGLSGANIQTLEYTPDGRLYGAGDRMYLVDPATGAATVASIEVLSDLRGLAYCRTNVVIDVTLQDYLGDLEAAPVTVELRRVGTTTVVESMTAPFSTFKTLGTNRVGTFDLAVKGAHWLRKVIPSVTIHADYTTPFQAASLVNGDCDGDNEIGIGDFSSMSSAFATAAGDPGFDPNADLNGDEAVDIGDYGILSANFGQAGED